MTRSTNARLAGAAYLAYIAAAFPAMMLGRRALAGTTVTEKLATLAQHRDMAHVEILLGLFSVLCALTLAVTLRAYTRQEDEDIAMFGLVCRAGEGLMAIPVISLALLWLAGGTANLGAQGEAIAALLIRIAPWQVLWSAWLFALGSTAFCYLIVRGRMIPTWLGWLGLAASVLLVSALPLTLIGRLRSPIADAVWAPMALFEIVFAIWLLYTGGERRLSHPER